MSEFHKPISIKHAMKIPDAKAAVDRELGNAHELASLGLQGSRAKGGRVWTSERPWVIRSLCISHGSLSLEPLGTRRAPSRGNKERVVIRGDNSGYRAVFSEQGASTSKMAAARIMDTISKLLGIAGKAHEARTSHAQVRISATSRLVR